MGPLTAACCSNLLLTVRTCTYLFIIAVIDFHSSFYVLTADAFEFSFSKIFWLFNICSYNVFAVAMLVSHLFKNPRAVQYGLALF